MNETAVRCSFCGVEQSPTAPFIAGAEGHICEACVRLANQVVTSWGRKRALAELNGPLPTPAAIKQRLDQYIIGQDLAKEILAVAVYNHYKRLKCETATSIAACSDQVELGKSNILLFGPSGSGKTLLASTLARIVGVPFAIADATTLTQAGYVGEDVESIVARLLDVADGNVGRAEWGIVYIDEVDKLARSPESSTGVRDVSGEGVQQALLKLVEGTQVKVSQKGRRREGGDDVTLDTNNILFIVGGAFVGLDEMVTRRLAPKRTGIGFHAGMEEPESVPGSEEILNEVRPEDLRRFGLIPEFIGRFPVLAGLEPLDEEAMVQILTEPRNSLVRQFTRLFSYDGVDLQFTDAALRVIARQAIERGTGARGLRGVLEQLLRRSMFDLPSRTELKHCLVDEDIANGDAAVVLSAGGADAEQGTQAAGGQ